jgi:hypothetical protein
MTKKQYSWSMDENILKAAEKIISAFHLEDIASLEKNRGEIINKLKEIYDSDPIYKNTDPYNTSNREVDDVTTFSGLVYKKLLGKFGGDEGQNPFQLRNRTK